MKRETLCVYVCVHVVCVRLRWVLFVRGFQTKGPKYRGHNVSLRSLVPDIDQASRTS